MEDETSENITSKANKNLEANTDAPMKEKSGADPVMVA